MYVHRCGVCEQICSSQETFSQHQTLHNQQDLHKCPKCPRFFTQQGNLEQHLHSHGRKKPRDIACAVCGKILKNPDNLKRHMYIHTGRYIHRLEVFIYFVACQEHVNQPLTLPVQKKWCYILGRIC